LSAAALVLFGATLAAAQPAIPGGDLPGQARQRFVDPPGAQLMQPTAPIVAWPSDARPKVRDCRPRTSPRKARSRRRC